MVFEKVQVFHFCLGWKLKKGLTVSSGTWCAYVPKPSTVILFSLCIFYTSFILRYKNVHQLHLKEKKKFFSGFGRSSIRIFLSAQTDVYGPLYILLFHFYSVERVFLFVLLLVYFN